MIIVIKRGNMGNDHTKLRRVLHRERRGGREGGVERMKEPISITESPSDNNNNSNNDNKGVERKGKEGERYRELDLTFTETRIGGNFIQLSRIFFYDSTDTLIPFHQYSVKNERGNNPSNEGVDQLHNDSVYSKWLDMNLLHFGSSRLIFSFSSPVHIKRYSFTTANDCPERDPFKWTLYGIPSSSSSSSSSSSGEWEILDQRSSSSADISQERYQNIHIPSLNYGNEVKIDRSLRLSSAHIPPHILSLTSSSDLIEHWSKKKKIAKEYKMLRDEMIVDHKSILSVSKLAKLMRYLDKEVIEKGKGAGLSFKLANFIDLVKKMIRKVYITDNNNNNRRVREEEINDPLEGRNLYTHIVKYYKDLASRSIYLHAAFMQLYEKEESSGLIGILSLAARAGAECFARQRMAFSSILLSISPFIPSSSLLSSSSSLPIDDNNNNDNNNNNDINNNNNDDNNKGNGEGISEEMKEERKRVEEDKKRVLEWFEEYMDEYKAKAFKSAFLEPSKLYFHMVGEYVLRDDVEVHGSNVFAALLLSTLAVQLPTVPYLNDVVNPAPFLSLPSLSPAYDLFLQPQYFGHDWTAIGKIQEIIRSSNHNYYYHHQRVGRGVFSGSTPKEIANYAVRAEGRDREEYLRYISRFSHFFKAPFFLERTFLQVMSDDGQPLLIQRLFSHYVNHVLPSSSDLSPDQRKDIRNWIYEADEDGVEYSFLISRCLLFIHWLGPSFVHLPNDNDDDNDDNDDNEEKKKKNLSISNEDLYKNEIEILKEMGYTINEETIEILHSLNGDVDETLLRLTSL